jgi:DNA-directed RNA polymerase specialized sigma24 family protein
MIRRAAAMPDDLFDRLMKEDHLPHRDRRFSRTIAAGIRRMRSKERAEEVAGETEVQFLYQLKGRPENYFVERDPARGPDHAHIEGCWWTIASHVIPRELSRSGRQPRQFQPGEELAVIARSLELDPERLERTVFRALARVREPYRTPLEMYVWLDVTLDELASMLGRNVSTVRGQVVRGREMLKVELQKELDDLP